MCVGCGGALHSIGESVSEMLDWVPAQLRVLRIVRPKYACRTSEAVVQAPAPERPIAGGLETPALLAQVLVSKYCAHAALSAVADLRPPQSGSGPVHPRWMGGRRMLVARTAARASGQKRVRVQSDRVPLCYVTEAGLDAVRHGPG